MLLLIKNPGAVGRYIATARGTEKEDLSSAHYQEAVTVTTQVSV